MLIEKRQPYTGNPNSKTPGDNENAFLYWGDVLGCMQQKGKLVICSLVAQARHELQPVLVSVSLLWDFSKP